MSQILNKVRDVDPNNSDAVKEALVPFFQNLPKHIEGDCNRWLRTLENVINRFPKFCMSSRPNIETYLSHFLDCSNYYTVIEAAKCAHALQQVRPTQEKTATPKSGWRDQMTLLCDAAHEVIGALFPHAVDIYQHRKTKQNKDEAAANSPLKATLSQINRIVKSKNDNGQNKKSVLCTRLKNIFVFIQAMLVEIYPVAKPVRPQKVLDVVVRALSVTSGTSSLGAAEVCSLKTQALRTLDALVACLGSNLIPFSPLVFRVIMKTLKWTSENPSEDSSTLRRAAYSSACGWLARLRCAGGARRGGWQDELAAHVIRDVTPHVHVVELTMSKQPTKNLSKKAKRKLANTMLQDSALASHAPGEKNKLTGSEEVNDEVALAALECAETFLTVCGIFLKPDIHKQFQERLVRDSYALLTNMRPRSLPLLRALEASRRAAPAAAPPPTQHCLHVYSQLLAAPDRQISAFCSRALLDIRLHLHCSPPSLNFSIEVQPEKEKKEAEKKMKISKRNRAALEALLGTDKVPQENESVDDEVISIPDEPQNKRPRNEDVEDNISLSSESVQSVEESDSEPDNTEDDIQAIEECEADVHQEDPKEIVFNKDKESDDVATEDITDVTDGTNEPTEPVQDETINTTEENANIYEAKTQLPADVSNEPISIEEDEPLSMEVGYDYPNTGKDEVKVLEKVEDENLPSTNETDDIQITCGQVVKNSQENDHGKSTVDLAEKVEEVPKVNGVASPEKVVQNGVVDDIEKEKVAAKGANDLSVEDMLADFVDEVNDDTQVTQA